MDIILILLVIVVLGGGFGGYRWYNRPVVASNGQVVQTTAAAPII